MQNIIKFIGVCNIIKSSVARRRAYVRIENYKAKIKVIK